MNPQELPKGPGLESDGMPAERKPVNKAGVYEHPGAKVQLIVMPDGKSTSQADALVRMGYVWVGPPPTRGDIKRMQDARAASDAKSGNDGFVEYPSNERERVLFNGTVTDKGGDGDALAAKDAEIAALQAQLAETQARAAQAVPAETATPETQTNQKKGK